MSKLEKYQDLYVTGIYIQKNFIFKFLKTNLFPHRFGNHLCYNPLRVTT